MSITKKSSWNILKRQDTAGAAETKNSKGNNNNNKKPEPYQRLTKAQRAKRSHEEAIAKWEKKKETDPTYCEANPDG